MAMMKPGANVGSRPAELVSAQPGRKETVTLVFEGIGGRHYEIVLTKDEVAIISDAAKKRRPGRPRKVEGGVHGYSA